MSASLFDLYCLEVVPQHMAEVKRLSQQWQDLFSQCVDDPNNAKLDAEGYAALKAYEAALDEARKAFSSNWPSYNINNS